MSPQVNAATPAASRYQLARSVGPVEADADQDAGHRHRADGLVQGVTAGRVREREVPGDGAGPDDQEVLPCVGRSMARRPRPSHPVAIGRFGGWVEPGGRRADRLRSGPTPATYATVGRRCRPPSTRPAPSICSATSSDRWPPSCSPLSDDQWERATCLPGWSVQDVLEPHHRDRGDAGRRAGPLRRPLAPRPHEEPGGRGQRGLGRIDAALSGPEMLDRFGQSPVGAWPPSTP